MKTKIVTAVLSVLTMAGLTFIWGNASFAAGHACVWTGAGSDNNFSTVANWTDCGGSTPTAGDVISIGYDDVTDGDVLINDGGVALGGVNVAQPASSGGSSKNVAINSLSLVDNAVLSDSGTGYGLYVVVGTAVNDVAARADITAAGSVSMDTASLTYKNIKATGVVTVPSDAYYYYQAGDTMSKLVVANGGYAGFYATQTPSTISFPIDVNGGTGASLAFYGYCLEMTGPMSCGTWEKVNWIVSGAINASQATKIDTGIRTTAYFAGSVNDKALLTNGPNAAGEFKFGTPETAGASAKEEVKLEGDSTASVSVTVNQIATLTGSRGNIDVYGELKGTGMVNGLLMVHADAKIAPGMSPGCITTEVFALDGEYQFELGSNDPCSGYDQIKVTDPAESVYLDSNATVVTSRYNNFTPKQNQVFTIIDNQGSEAVDGTFKDLPEGATFTQNGVVFKISYVGGTGNDVTLTVMNQPTAPNTGFELVKANPTVIAAAALVATIALLVIGRRLQTQR